MENRKEQWYNYKTCSLEDYAEPEDYTDYLPQQLAVIAIYNTYMAMGKTPREAYMEAMNAYIAKQESGAALSVTVNLA